MSPVSLSRQFLMLTFLVGVTKSIETHHRHDHYRNITHGLKAKDPESGPWGDWSDSSSCSRTCGGGIAYQTRKCLDPRPGSCRGPWKKYFSCNIQDCPEGSQDFREAQCASFNPIPFEGKLYNWVPYHKASRACELNCMPKGERFYYRHSQKVKDGTRCYDDGSLDVCVDGACMPVGCDMMLGSELKEDKCRECNGDGSTCKTVQGLFDLDNLQVGYNDVLLIPAGATNIMIKERHATNNYLAIRNLTGHFYLNGNWRIEFPRSMKFAGTVFHYERKAHSHLSPDMIKALGPTTEAIFIVLLYQEKNQGISYEYSIPNGVNNAQPDTYSWIFGDFGECSSSCGGGHQVRPVNCAKTSNFEVVADYLCDPSLKPSTNRSCNTQPCPARWHVGEWDACSSTCGGGSQYRLVHCQRRLNGNSIVLVPESECSAPKPVYVRKCNVDEPCPHWKVGAWSACNKMCGEGNQTRVIVCQRELKGHFPELVHDSYCNLQTKPETTQLCDAGPCEGVEWIVSDWTGCDATCGLQMESREVYCSTENGHLYPLDKCETTRLPLLTRPCHENLPCHAVWHASEWTECSAKCGTGIQTRLVFCGVWEGQHVKKVSEAKCKPNKKHSSVQNCTVAPCKGMWFSSPWSRCTVPCGGGHRTRKVMCLHKDEMVPNSRCDPSTRPFHKEPCNLHSCDEDEIMMVGGCKNSKHGCCPDGVTPAGRNFEGCPPMEEMSPEGCEKTEFGCCADGITPALSLFKQGCPKMDTCNDTKYGCCPDGITPAKGPNGEECQDTCETSTWGCCPDDLTPAAGRNYTGCDFILSVPCAQSKHGCCPDGFTAAEGPDSFGCETIESSGEECSDSKYGCCSDGLTPADGPNQLGCPEKPVIVQVPTPTVSTLCVHSKYGCCQDGVSAAKGPKQEGCDEIEGSGEPSKHCLDTIYGCCEDGITAATGPNGEGCKDGGVVVSIHCGLTKFGCCPDGINAARGAHNEGCEEVIIATHCGHTQYGCCPDGITAATGPNQENCESDKPEVSTESEKKHKTTEIPPPESTTLHTPKQTEETTTVETIACFISPYGCCPDGITEALGPQNQGCCRTSQNGCCPDNITEAHGPQYYGCGCHTFRYGCCPDSITPAKGPRYDGCTCEHYPFGCCQDKSTPARGSNFAGCHCEYMLYGCCSDGVTPATGKDKENCGCQNTLYGCCPDGYTPAKGHQHEGCTCKTYPHGCCPDGRTAATGPNYAGCGCLAAPFGCCPDKKTAAHGPNFEGCSCITAPYGCCHDGSTAAQGPDFEGCPRTPSTPVTKTVGEICNLPKERGPCHNYTVKWFFDMNYGGCSRFWFGGCEGNKNRFSTQQECEQKCVSPEGADACLLPKVVGPCTGSYPSWHYDSSSGKCHSFIYGGCLGNNNRFETNELCEQSCIHQETLDQCEQPLSPGPCKGTFERWYYDKYEGFCKRFLYGGCKGNDNNFNSEKECVDRCASFNEREICILPKVEGPCLGNFGRWYYDYMEGHCKEFVYSGCQGNRNRFVSKNLCEKICNSTHVAVSSDICTLPKAEGPCQAAILHWYYSTASRRCEQFYYGGCEGNANRFESRADCERACFSDKEENVCMMPHERGNCHEFSERWYHDYDTGHCRRFYYSGCGGNGNNFPSYSECEKKCGKPTSTELPEDVFSKEFCFMDHDAGPCSRREIRWFYDKTDGVCKEFYYGGCNGNGNRFSSRRDCEKKCGESQDICMLPKVRGPCSRSFSQWYYDHSNDRCVQFAFSGCQGNANRFNDKDTCELHCKKNKESTSNRVDDICSHDQDPGPCTGYLLRWYYSSLENACKVFVFGGCGGNENRFESKKECEKQCVMRNSYKPGDQRNNVLYSQDSGYSNGNGDVCRLPVEAGPCNEVHGRWFYDSDSQTCLPFVYGGCKGNKNRFKTHDLCLRFCNGVRSIPRDAAAVETDSNIPVEVIDSLTCPPSRCGELQCPYGKDELTDDHGCPYCQCTNPCRTHSCPNDTQCTIDVYHTEEGDPRARAMCRLTNKPGKCPSHDSKTNDSDCRDRCLNDAYCWEEQKCCYNGCSHQCFDPVPEVTTVTEIPSPAITTSSPVPPHITMAEKEILVEEGKDVTLRCVARGFPQPHITWTKNGHDLEVEDQRMKFLVDGSLHISPVRQSDSSQYRCMADNGVGQPASRFIILKVYVPLVVRIQTKRHKYSAGTTVRLHCSVTGTPVDSVNWYFQNTTTLLRTDGQTEILSNHTLLIQNAKAANAGVYICSATNRLGEVSDSTTIKIEDLDIPENCTDTPFFANCDLIVKAQYCVNRYYGKFCCRSCTIAGQLVHQPPNHL